LGVFVEARELSRKGPFSAERDYLLSSVRVTIRSAVENLWWVARLS